MSIQVIIFSAGIAILYAGGMFFIRGSAGTARIYSIRPIIIGAVVIAFATSAPEFFVSVIAAVKRSSDLAIGNIVGSCICNIGMVLGLSALIKPVKVNNMVLRRELPILLSATILLFLACLDYRINRFEAGLFILGFFLFIFHCIKNAKEHDNGFSQFREKGLSKIRSFMYLCAGLAGLLTGAHLIVNSAILLAGYFGISKLVIGLTVVAIGTSLPELAASAIAAHQGEGDISIGNVIGSNLFNILGIVGIVCLIRPVYISRQVIWLSAPFLLIYTLALVPIIRSGYRINRPEAAALFLSYFLYLYLIFKI